MFLPTKKEGDYATGYFIVADEQLLWWFLFELAIL